MALFAVILPQEDEELEAAIKAKFPDTNHYKISSTQWIVSGKGTAQKISDKLGITGDGSTIGNGIVLAFTGYWGRASTDLWEWMKAKIEESDNG